LHVFHFNRENQQVLTLDASDYFLCKTTDHNNPSQGRYQRISFICEPSSGKINRSAYCNSPLMAISFNRQDIHDRARAAFIGLAVGDAMGAAVEFMTPGEIQSKYGCLTEILGGGWLKLKPGQVTDDTEMSLCIARAICSENGWSLSAVADNFAAWLRSKPVDIGDTCRRGIRNYMLKGELESPFNQWDAGNGACMRMLPVALFTLGSEELLQQFAVEQGHLTHNHPLSDSACVYLGKIVQKGVFGLSKTGMRKELEGLFSRYENFRFEPYRGLATAYVVDTMQTVFHHFFTTRDFEECIVNTVNQGGDADTTGAIAGMIAGAYYGRESIPKRWLKKMNRNILDEISLLAERLVEMSPLFKQDLREESSD
jgi:ADP-ribosyl-[dinitrogen reductase] hydrolase